MPTASTYTGNLNLEKQAPDQFYDITVVNDNLQKVDDAFGRNHLIISQSNVSAFTASGVSGLPITNVNIKRSHRIVNMILSNPEAQKSDWAYDITDGKITLKGTLFGTTNITLILAEVSGAAAASNIKINAFSVMPKNTILSAANVTADDSILSLEPGFYTVRETSAAGIPYFPHNYGVLIAGVTGTSYRTYIFISSAGEMYYRQGTSTNWNYGWQQSDHSISFGDKSKTLATVLTENWQNEIPNAKSYPILVQVEADNTNYYGFLSRYSTRYGSGILTRYDNKSYSCFMNDTTVTVRPNGTEVTVFSSGTLASVQAALVTFCGTIIDNEVRHIRFALTTAEEIFNTTTYMGTITRVNSTRFIVSIQGVSTPGQSIKGIYNNGTWSWCLEGLYYVTDNSAFSSFEAGCERGGTSTTLAKQGRIATMSGSIKITSAFTSDYSQLFTINEAFKPLREVEFIATDLSANKAYAFYIRTTGEVCSRPAVPVASLIVFNASWVTATYN